MGGHWYAGEPVPGECVTNPLPINDGISTSWALDLQRMQDTLWGLLDGGEMPALELLVEKDKEEEQRERTPMAGEAGPS